MELKLVVVDQMCEDKQITNYSNKLMKSRLGINLETPTNDKSKSNL